MIGKVKRAAEVFTREGLKTFGYLVKDNLRARKSEKEKYRIWRKQCEKPELPKRESKADPFFSVLLTGSDGLQTSLASLESQSYDGWEAVPCDEEQMFGLLLEKCKGDYIAFLRSGDRLAPGCLGILANAIKAQAGRVQMYYTDEDVSEENGERSQPHFKPGYSPDTLRCFFYIGGLFVIKRELAEKLEYCKRTNVRYNGYLLALEASFLIEKSQVKHIDKVLYHRQEKSSWEWAGETAQSSETPERLMTEKEQLFDAYGIEIRAEKVEDCVAARIIYQLSSRPKISIIIPSKDSPQMFARCLKTITQSTRYDNLELIVVDNGSRQEARNEYEQILENTKISCRYHYEQMDFNFSKMCNIGAKEASGEYFLFLNDDMAVLESTKEDWLERLLGQAMQPHTGAVGAKLLYPSDQGIQHAGVVNYESGAAHVLSQKKDDEVLAFGRNRMDYNYSVVTGACIFISADKFWKTGGFLEELAVTFNDVELCFRLLKAGYYNVVRNDVCLCHFESISRGQDALDQKKFFRHLKEREKLFALHPEFVKRDEFYSKNLTQKLLDCSVNVDNLPTDMPVIHNLKWQNSLKNGGDIVCTIESAMAGEEVCIRGFAFLENIRYNNLNQVFVRLKGQAQTLCVKALTIYNPTIAMQVQSKKNLNFAEFYVSFSAKHLKEERYEIGIILKPFGSERRYLYESNKTITNQALCD